jgi:hypothetical protein
MIKSLLLTILFVLLAFACKTDNQSNSFSFETGNFKSYLESKKDSSSFYRVDHFQIETYKNQTDTFHIKWKNKFEFHLKKVHPTSKLDSTNFVVKITKIKNNAYDFEAGYENSNFKQKGSTYKIE